MEDFWSAPPIARFVNSSLYSLYPRSLSIGSCLILMDRTWTAATLLTSVLIYGRMVNGLRLIFGIPYVFKLPVPEVWRILSSFCITGPDWAILYDTYFREYYLFLGMCNNLRCSVWTYSSNLERESPRFTQSGDFFYYVFFIGSIILVSPTLA